MKQRTIKTWVTLLSMMSVMLIGFQNCSDKQFSQSDESSLDKLGQTGTITVMEGTTVTTPIVVNPSAMARTLTWTVQNSSVDLTTTSGTLSIAAGNAGGVLTLTAKSRPGLQGQRVYLLTFQENGVSIDDMGRNVVVTDAPEATPTPTPTTPTPTPPTIAPPKIDAIAENCVPMGDCRIHFRLRSAAAQVVDFDWRTNDSYPGSASCPMGTVVINSVQYTCASPNTHYTPTSGHITFPAGSAAGTTATIVVKSKTSINIQIQVLMSSCQFNNNLINCRPDYFD